MVARIARRPTLWVELGVALVWVGLILGSVLQGESAAAGQPHSSGGSLWVCMTGVAQMGGAMAAHAEGLALSDPATSLAATLPMLALMAMAMMLPPAMPAIHHIALNSLYWRRRRAVFEFAIVLVAIWATYSVVVLGVVGSSGAASAPLAPATALAIAALWQLTPLKRRALQNCHRTRPLPPKGRRATTAVAGFGFSNGLACLASCWAMMLTTAFVGLPKLAWMATLTVLITAERVSIRPRRACLQLGAVLAAGAILAVALALA
jgi:predicted metal-binding membrane protein